jgi:NitT/TauT family transport system substrate-binding protein
MMKLTRVVALAATLVAGLTACGGQGGSTVETEGDMTVVTVSVVPSIDAASLYLGDDQGFFREEGIRLEFVDAGSGPASVAAVMGDTAQFGLAANVALVQARANNIPILGAAPAAGTGADPEQSKDQVVVDADSAVRGFADLEGKTVAVAAVRNAPELFVRDLIDQDGGDSSTARFVELPFAEMGAALSSGRVDAIAINEPFLAGVVAEGGRPIGSYIDEVLGPDTAYTYWFTSEEYANATPDTVSAFARVMEHAGDYADEHPEEVRRVVIDKLGIDPAVAENIRLPRFGNPMDPDSIATVAELMQQYDFITSEPMLDDILFEQ